MPALRPLVLASLVLLGSGACGDPVTSAPVKSEDASACPASATCVEATGDIDGDGRADQVASYSVGEELAPEAAGVVVVFADGRQVSYEVDRWTRSATGGLVGVGALDDLPGDEIVVATSSAPGEAQAIILHWAGGHLTAVPVDGEHDDPFNLQIGTDGDYAGGFSCDDTDGDGQRDLQVHGNGFGDPTWRVRDYRWVDGRLEPREHQPPDDGDPGSDADHLGVRCDGFERFGIDDIADRPEPAQPLCPPSARCQTSRGDIDGDGRDDDVTYYELDGADQEPDESGVVVGFADGRQARHPFVFPADEYGVLGGLAGIAPLDDVAGEEIVAVVHAGAHGRNSRIVHWADGDLEEIADPDGHDPLSLFTDGSAGFSCDDADGDGQRDLQVYEMGRNESDAWEGEITSYRWHDGRLEQVGRTELGGTDESVDIGRYSGNRCKGVSDNPDTAP